MPSLVAWQPPAGEELVADPEPAASPSLSEDTTCWLSMESPQMYDLSESIVKQPSLHNLTNSKPAKLGGGGYGEEFAELADLGASEVSLDLQAFVNDPHFSDGIFTDIVDNKSLGQGGGRASNPAASCSSLPYSSGGYLPPAQPCTQRQPNAPSAAPVKKDPDGDFTPLYRPSPPVSSSYPGVNAYSPAYTSLTPASSVALATANRPPTSQPPRASVTPKSSSSSSTSSGGGGKKVDRASEEYRRRRERNNVAVRRSREKAKQRSRETEERVKFLTRENDGLHKRIEILAKELGVLKNLFANVGVLPDQLHREIAKHLGEGFNQRPNGGL